MRPQLDGERINLCARSQANRPWAEHSAVDVQEGARGGCEGRLERIRAIYAEEVRVAVAEAVDTLATSRAVVDAVVATDRFAIGSICAVNAHTLGHEQCARVADAIHSLQQAPSTARATPSRGWCARK